MKFKISLVIKTEHKTYFDEAPSNIKNQVLAYLESLLDSNSFWDSENHQTVDILLENIE